MGIKGAVCSETGEFATDCRRRHISVESLWALNKEGTVTTTGALSQIVGYIHGPS